MRTYTGKNLDLIAYPLGGIGAGTLCLNGTGSFGSVSLRHRPALHNHPNLFSVLTLLGDKPVTRVLEAPVPDVKLFANVTEAGRGLKGTNYGFPRFAEGEFSSRFPFATLRLTDPKLPVAVELTGWSPFIPGDEDRSSLPFAAVEYRFINTGSQPLEAIYYFCSQNFMKQDDRARVRAVKNGFVLEQPGSPEARHLEGAFCAAVDQEAMVDAAWFRGGWFDTMTMLWNGMEKGLRRQAEHADPENGPSAGGTLSVPLTLAPGESRTIRLRFSWYVPHSGLRISKRGESECGDTNYVIHNGVGDELPTYQPWYVSVLDGVDEAEKKWREAYDSLREDTSRFTDCFYDTSLPEELTEAVAANLPILKSPTLLRQTDGRLWGWEGCGDDEGSCYGSCTHVFNYAQSICHLFPALERSLRESEFFEGQANGNGHQEFRLPLPIRPTSYTLRPASDGQLGGIIKVYRDWRISGDEAWLRHIWPQVRDSLDYCIHRWDPDGEGIIKEPHHNTYDIEFWGPDGMNTTVYLGALLAACEMAKALGEDFGTYQKLYGRGRAYLEEKLYNGEYFFQRVMRKELQAVFDPSGENPETRELLESEGPKYQYGAGCLSDGVFGVWLSEVCGLSGIVDEEKLLSNLDSIYRYNFRKDLSDHSNPQRPGYALKNEAGLLLCSWPHGGKPSLPFVYSDEVWTGIEYQVASHLLSRGRVSEGLDIVRGLRARYDGSVRNPFNEYECGHWYARAMASYALLYGYTGVRYDAVSKTLYYSASNQRDYRVFLCTAAGYGTVEVRDGRAALRVVSGEIPVESVVEVK